MAQYDWTKLIEPAFGIGGQLLGNVVQNKLNPNMQKEQIQEQARQWDQSMALKQGEMGRRNQIAGAVAPTMLHALGYRDPNQIKDMSAKFAAPQPQVGGQAPNYGTSAPQEQGGGALKTVGGAALGTAGLWGPLAAKGIKSLVGGGGTVDAFGKTGAAATGGGKIGAFLTNPWTAAGAGAALGGAALVKSQAHWEANDIVKNVENPMFWQQWSQTLPSDNPEVLSKLPPEQATDLMTRLSAMNDQYLQKVAEFKARGGQDDVKVSDQSVNNTQPHFQRIMQALQRAAAGGQLQ